MGNTKAGDPLSQSNGTYSNFCSPFWTFQSCSFLYSLPRPSVVSPFHRLMKWFPYRQMWRLQQASPTKPTLHSNQPASPTKPTLHCNQPALPTKPPPISKTHVCHADRIVTNQSFSRVCSIVKDTSFASLDNPSLARVTMDSFSTLTAISARTPDAVFSTTNRFAKLAALCCPMCSNAVITSSVNQIKWTRFCWLAVPANCSTEIRCVVFQKMTPFAAIHQLKIWNLSQVTSNSRIWRISNMILSIVLNKIGRIWKHNQNARFNLFSVHRIGSTYTHLRRVGNAEREQRLSTFQITMSVHCLRAEHQFDGFVQILGVKCFPSGQLAEQFGLFANSVREMQQQIIDDRHGILSNWHPGIDHAIDSSNIRVKLPLIRFPTPFLSAASPSDFR